MLINGQHYRTIWEHPARPDIIKIIDQRPLPYHFVIEDLQELEQIFTAIQDMHVRGAGLIGAAGAYGIYLASIQYQNSKTYYSDLLRAADVLRTARPTAINLTWAIDRQLSNLTPEMEPETIIRRTLVTARAIADEDAQACYQIGQHGLPLILRISKSKPAEPVNVLTHCNAGWLAFVDHGSATAPIYAAHAAGIPVHVWVDETRPRNQGSRLTAWELEQQGVPFTLITDNMGGHLMQKGQVDLVLVGSDRTTFSGDVANKIGTYLKALAAADNQVPFYVALPSSTFDWDIADGVSDIPIEHRDSGEVNQIQGLLNGKLETVLLSTATAPVLNAAFDVTPGRLVTGLITERGICRATAKDILTLFPERRSHA